VTENAADAVVDGYEIGAPHAVGAARQMAQVARMPRPVDQGQRLGVEATQRMPVAVQGGADTAADSAR